jgi:hypothetical protein|tara:strand:- start:1341 stop:2150 length:810 start_codon:yes stop_codon:yes gene_type:complete
MILSEVLNKISEKIEIGEMYGPFAVPKQFIDKDKISTLSEIPIEDHDGLEELLYSELLDDEIMVFYWPNAMFGSGAETHYLRYRGLKGKTLYFQFDGDGPRLLCIANKEWSRRLDLEFIDLLGQNNGEHLKTGVFGPAPDQIWFNLTCSWTVLVNFIYNVLESAKLWDELPEWDNLNLWAESWEYPDAEIFLSKEDEKILEKKFAEEYVPKSYAQSMSYHQKLKDFKLAYSKRFGLSNRKILYKRPKALTPEIKQIIAARYLQTVKVKK